MTDTTHADHLSSTVRELQRRHPDHDPADIERRVRAEQRRHDGDRVRAFIPILVTRAVEDRLRRTPPGAVASRREDEP